MRKTLAVTMILMAIGVSAFAWEAPTENKGDCPYATKHASVGAVHDSPFIMTGTQTLVDAKVQAPGAIDSGPSDHTN